MMIEVKGSTICFNLLGGSPEGACQDGYNCYVTNGSFPIHPSVNLNSGHARVATRVSVLPWNNDAVVGKQLSEINKLNDPL